MNFTMRRDLPATTFDQALERLPAALREEGFGVLTRVDVDKTLHEKLGVDFRRYTILGACNPGLAHAALQRRLDIGAMLPCNLVVYEEARGGCVVLAIDPSQTLASADPELAPIAGEVRARLAKVLDNLP